MAALDTANYKFIVNESGNPANDVPVDMRVTMMRLLLDMGFSAFVISNSAPSDKTTLWWHKDASQAKRFVVATGAWTQMTPAQHALHIMQRCVLAATPEGTIEAGDYLLFYDVSAGEVKKIERNNAADAFGRGLTIAAYARGLVKSTGFDGVAVGCTATRRVTSGNVYVDVVATSNHGICVMLETEGASGISRPAAFNIGNTKSILIGDTTTVNSAQPNVAFVFLAVP